MFVLAVAIGARGWTKKPQIPSSQLQRRALIWFLQCGPLPGWDWQEALRPEVLWRPEVVVAPNQAEFRPRYHRPYWNKRRTCLGFAKKHVPFQPSVHHSKC